jgi:hypothetical protein
MFFKIAVLLKPGCMVSGRKKEVPPRRSAVSSGFGKGRPWKSIEPERAGKTLA